MVAFSATKQSFGICGWFPFTDFIIGIFNKIFFGLCDVDFGSVVVSSGFENALIEATKTQAKLKN
jgi:hypothetical protein